MHEKYTPVYEITQNAQKWHIETHGGHVCTFMLLTDSIELPHFDAMWQQLFYKRVSIFHSDDFLLEALHDFVTGADYAICMNLSSASRSISIGKDSEQLVQGQ